MRFLEDQNYVGSTATPGHIDDDDLDVRGNAFSWGILILILLGLNIGSWAFCSMIFGHPDHPLSYGLLTRLDKLEPLKGFQTTTAPAGEFNTAKEIYATTYPFSRSQLRAYNGLLMRHYLWNYKDNTRATFIYGNFTVENVRPVERDEFFERGVVLVGQPESFPDARLHLVLPTAEDPGDETYFSEGETFELGKSNMAAAVLRVTKAEDETITILAVPLVTRESGETTRSYQTSTGQVLTLKTPRRLSI